MDRSDVMHLIGKTYTQNSIGQYVATETSTKVYCDVHSISRAEWFDAGRSGIKPQIAFSFDRNEYDGQTIVEYGGKRYGVYRTYEAKNEAIELYCESKGGV